MDFKKKEGEIASLRLDVEYKDTELLQIKKALQGQGSEMQLKKENLEL